MIRSTLILLLSLFISTGVMAGDKCCKKEKTKSCCEKKSSCSEKKSSCCEKKTSCAETKKSCGSTSSHCSGNTHCNGAPSGHEVCCQNLSLDNECDMDGNFCHKVHECEDMWWW